MIPQSDKQHKWSTIKAGYALVYDSGEYPWRLPPRKELENRPPGIQLSILLIAMDCMNGKFGGLNTAIDARGEPKRNKNGEPRKVQHTRETTRLDILKFLLHTEMVRYVDLRSEK